LNNNEETFNINSLLFFSLYFLTCLLFQTNESIQSTCNYVYNAVDKKAWATKVCIPYNSQSSLGYHVQYLCINGSMNVEYYSDNECSQLVSSINLADYINMLDANNDTSVLTYSYSCQGRDGCYAGYLENCENSNNIINYPPIQSCISDTSTSSWMIDCDDDALFYALYKDNSCNEVESLQLVTTCRQMFNTTWQYWGCQLPPTPTPTLMPTFIPSISPSISPTMSPISYPTWYIPFYGLNLSGLVNNVVNDQSSNTFIMFSFNLNLLWTIILITLLITFP